MVLERNPEYWADDLGSTGKGSGVRELAAEGDSAGAGRQPSLSDETGKDGPPNAVGRLTHKIERVRFEVVPDAITSALELKKGSADLASNVVTHGHDSYASRRSRI